MGGIFISYRRDDSRGTAGRLYDDLTDRFGRDSVFRDIDAVGIGVDYAAVIGDFIATCDAVVVIIGNQWLEIRDEAGRQRLAEPGDLVAEEIATALGAGKLVIPVLVEDADMPSAAYLPPALAPLPRLNALRVSDDRWDYDVGRLVTRLEQVLPAVSSTAPPGATDRAVGVRAVGVQPVPPRPGRRRVLVGAAASVVVIAALVVSRLTFLGGNDKTNGTVTTVQVTTTVTSPATTTTLARVTTTTTTTAPGTAASITLSRSTGPAGTSITVGGRGFNAGETVEVRFHVTQLATVVATLTGTFGGVVIQVPAGSPKGFPFMVSATGKTSAKTARAPFTVT